MKKLLWILVLTSISFAACKKDDNGDTPADPIPVPPPAPAGLTVVKKNMAAVIYFGEDWCPPCGSYGGPTLDSLLANQEGITLTGIKINKSSNNSSLNCAAAGTAWSPFNSGVFGSANAIPSMAINLAKQSITTNIGYNFNQGIVKVNTFVGEPVVAGVAMSKSFDGDSIKIKTKVKFFQSVAAGSDYRLATYVVEDDVVASQSMSSGPSPLPNYVHRNVVRTLNGTTYTGAILNNSAAIATDEVFETTYKIYVKPTWNKNNLKVVSVIWKMGTTPATVVNSNVIN